MSAFRLPRGGLVDRGKPLTFRFDGRAYRGFAGDTLASALLANGVSVVGRSFKYHRPRGVLTAGSEEPNALVELRAVARREPNTKATVTELFDGLVASSQNAWPSRRFDLLALNGLFGSLIGAGFYYKTFMWPAAFWEKLYEPFIRRAAGLGAASALADPDAYERAYAFCDVLIIGAGPAGLSAALTASRAGARVILADEDFVPGGRLTMERDAIDGMHGAEWAARAIEELRGDRRSRFMPRTTVFGVYDGGTYGALERVADHLPEPPPFTPRQRHWRIVSKRCVLAAGATERPLVFEGNDRPGVVLAGATRAYINRFGVGLGANVAVHTCCDDGWRAAFDAAAAGVGVACVVDTRGDVAPDLIAAARKHGLVFHLGARVERVAARFGRIVAMDVRLSSGNVVALPIDGLAMSGGWSPTIALVGHHGARPRWRDDVHAFVADALPRGMTIAGAANGVFSLAACLRDGVAAGGRAAEECGFTPRARDAPRASDELHDGGAFWHVGGSAGKAFVDFQNDVTAADVLRARDEGYRAVELLKRYTTLGMGTEQGRVGAVAGVALMADATGRSMGDAGVTMARPPFSPVAIGALAGDSVGPHYRPTRRTAAHEWAASRGGVFVETGPWLRARCFPRDGETHAAATAREARIVREDVGFCDVSTLGKFEVFGPDAEAFLDRVYANSISTIPVGRARYALMLREDGCVFDDGTVTRFAPTRFFVTSSTANAAAVLEHFEFCRQVTWPSLAVGIVAVADQWAQFAVAGPRSRQVLTTVLAPGVDVSDAALPFMAAREATLANGAPARVFRVSFSGERAFEIATPAGFGAELAEALARAGATPYGLDALDALRIEKGHVADTEINGQTTAFDLGLGRLLSAKKDFIGRALAARPALNEDARAQLVGVRAAPGARLEAGAHLARAGAPAGADNDEGHVTSAAFSPALGRNIGLALLARGRARHDEEMVCVDPLRGYETRVTVCDPVFVDPKGERARG